ncbi:AraC family transcriptional regulator [Pseudomonas sp. GT1P32]
MSVTRWASSLFAGVDFASGRLFDTSDYEQARYLTGQAFSPHELRVLDKSAHLRAILEQVSIGHLTLSRLNWQAPVQVDPGYLDDYYLLCIPTHGSAEFRHGDALISLKPGDIGVVGGAQRFHFSTTAGYDQVVLQFQRGMLESNWGSLTGEHSDQSLVFAGLIPAGSQAWRALAPVLASVVQCVNGGYDLRTTPNMPQRLCEMLMLALLINQPHSHIVQSVHRGRAGNSRDLKKVQAILSAHIEEPLNIAQLCVAVGVPARTIQSWFQKELGMGPMQWLREQRFFAIREALLGGVRPEEKVTDLAFRFQFNHLGEFSSGYRKMFGESPSETRRRQASD